MARGKLLHSCFELITWLDQTVPTELQLEAQLRRIDPTISDFGPVLDSFYEMIKRDNVRNLLTLESYQETYLLPFPSADRVLPDANRVEVQNERPFAVHLDSGILHGVIDRLVLVYERNRLIAADVIDFKTDAVSDSKLQQRVDYYRPQLAGYRQAVSQFAKLPLDKISTRLVFLESGSVVNLDLVENSASPEIVKFLPKPKRNQAERSNARPPAQAIDEDKKTSRSEHQQTLWPED